VVLDTAFVLDLLAMTVTGDTSGGRSQIGENDESQIPRTTKHAASDPYKRGHSAASVDDSTHRTGERERGRQERPAFRLAISPDGGDPLQRNSRHSAQRGEFGNL